MYTGVGALNWLPDIAGWARVVAGLLRPGGRLYVRDAHPMLITLSTTATDDDVLRVTLPYFEGNAQRWVSDADVHRRPAGGSPEQYEWNHGLGEIVQAVIDAGLHGDRAARAPRNANGRRFRSMVEGPDGKFRLAERPERLPLMFTLEARPRSGRRVG